MLLYLLHFDEPVGGKLHYGGSTDDHQLLTRLRRHQCGTGSSLTRRAHAAGVGFRLGAVLVIDDRNQEKLWKKAKRYRQDCTICCSRPDLPSLFPVGSHFEPIAIADNLALSSRRGFAIGWNRGHEKRRSP